MKILILNWRDVKHPRAGGAEFRLQQIYAPLVKQGHEVLLCSCAFPGCEPYDCIEGIEVRRFGSDLTFAPFCTVKLRSWVKWFRPDVVVEDFNKLPFYAPLVYKGPLIIQMHHLWRSSIFWETFFPAALFIRASEEAIRFVYRKNRFCVVSESTQKELLKMGVPPENIRVIHNGIDPLRYKPAHEPKEPFILWIGRIQRYKGPVDACKTIERLQGEFPGLRLVIVGSGPFRPELEKYIARRGLQGKITLTGLVSEEEKIRLLQRACVHLQSSRKEGWGLSVIEANACGCPVVANDASGLRDSCRNHETGLLYKYCDPNDAAEKIRDILKNEVLRERLVEKGYKWAGGFNWNRNADQIFDYLQEVVNAW